MIETNLSNSTVQNNEFLPPYLLVLFSLGIMRNAQGQRYIDSLWARDLIEHARYIKELTIIASTSNDLPATDATLIDEHPLLSAIRIFEIPQPKSTLSAIKNTPKVTALIWRELKRAKLVHSSVVSWPIPEAWLITPMLFFRKRLHLIIVESAFWRVSQNEPSIVKKIRANVHEFLSRKCLERADLSIFTHAGYMDSLLKKNTSRGHIISASWINESDILSEQALQEQIKLKLLDINQPIRLIFAGRLNQDKGVDFLINVIADIAKDAKILTLDIYGDGVLKEACEKIIAERGLSEQVRLRGMVNYGDEFYALLNNFDLMVVPSLTDEQPRIVYDAYSQGLPVLASDTAGLKQCVVDAKTGWLFNMGNKLSLEQKLLEIMSQRAHLAKLSADCVTYAHSMTHQEMHRRRLKLLHDLTAYA